MKVMVREGEGNLDRIKGTPEALQTLLGRLSDRVLMLTLGITPARYQPRPLRAPEKLARKRARVVEAARADMAYQIHGILRKERFKGAKRRGDYCRGGGGGGRRRFDECF